MSASRRRIYVAIGNRRDLSHRGGDVLNETKLYRRISTFADVYYNGQLIDWDAPGFGLDPDRPLGIPDDDFDLVYIRNNPELVASSRHPTIVTAYPYDKRIWQTTEGVLVTTQAWRDLLTGFNQQRVKRSVRRPWYPSRIASPGHILLAEQSVSPGFGPEPTDPRTKRFRARFGSGFTVGYIGRIDPTSFPYAATKAVERVRRTNPRITLVFVGRIRDVQIPDWAVIWPAEPHENMPFVTSAFDCLLYDQDDTGEWLGSAKVLEAMSCGIPVLARPHAARIEQLGENYPLFYETAQDVERLLVRLERDPSWRDEISAQLLERSSRYSEPEVARRLKREFERLFDRIQRRRGS